MSGNAGKLPYPPCARNVCTYKGPGFPSSDIKKAWPELVGHNAKECERRIIDENPYVTVVWVYRDKGTIDTRFCCNRVYLFVDETYNCYFTPTVG